MGRVKQWLAEIVGGDKPFERNKADNNVASKRPGPFAQDPSRTPPSKEDREKHYLREKQVTGNAAKRR